MSRRTDRPASARSDHPRAPAAPSKGGGREHGRRGHATARAAPAETEATPHRWSAEVTRKSDALDLEQGVFTHSDPKAIARSLRDSAEHSERRKSDPYRSAMSMLTFYVNRAGDKLDAPQRRVLEQAKDELRVLYDRPPRRPAKG